MDFPESINHGFSSLAKQSTGSLLFYCEIIWYMKYTFSIIFLYGNCFFINMFTKTSIFFCSVDFGNSNGRINWFKIHQRSDGEDRFFMISCIISLSILIHPEKKRTWKSVIFLKMKLGLSFKFAIRCIWSKKILIHNIFKTMFCL